MALPTSGQISLNQVATEFGTTNDMYALRGKAGSPTSGPIDIGFFRGKSAIIGHLLTDSEGGTVYGSLASLQDDNANDGYFQASSANNNFLLFAPSDDRKYVSSYVVGWSCPESGNRVSVSASSQQSGAGFIGDFRTPYPEEGVYREDTVTVGAWCYFLYIPPNAIIKKIRLNP